VPDDEKGGDKKAAKKSAEADDDGDLPPRPFQPGEATVQTL